jgi:hypothetical protein
MAKPWALGEHYLGHAVVCFLGLMTFAGGVTICPKWEYKAVIYLAVHFL